MTYVLVNNKNVQHFEQTPKFKTKKLTLNIPRRKNTTTQPNVVTTIIVITI